MSQLMAVDGAVVLGGPVEAAFTDARKDAFGIVGNAMGFDAPPDPEELAFRTAESALRSLLDQDRNSPMPVVNGADDVHVPQHDTLVFQGRHDTVVNLVPDTGYCAVSKLPEVFPTIIGWLDRALAATTGAGR